MLFLTNKLIRILGIDIFDMSKNITIDLMKMIESELIVNIVLLPYLSAKKAK